MEIRNGIDLLVRSEVRTNGKIKKLEEASLVQEWQIDDLKRNQNGMQQQIDELKEKVN